MDKAFGHYRAIEAKGLGLRVPVGKHLLSAIIFCSVLVILAKVTLSHLDWVGVICSENGPVERMSAGLWFMVFCWCMAVAWVEAPYRKEWLALGGMFLLLGLRELDAQRWVTGWNLDKLNNFFNPQFPLWERLMVVGLMVLPAGALVVALLHSAWVYLSKTKNWKVPWLGQLLTGGSLLLGCVLLDKVDAYYLPLLGIEEEQLFLMGVEEFMEFVLAAYVVSVLWPYYVAALAGRDCPP